MFIGNNISIPFKIWVMLFLCVFVCVNILTIAGPAITIEGVSRSAGASEEVGGVCAQLRAAAIVSIAFIHRGSYEYKHRKQAHTSSIIIIIIVYQYLHNSKGYVYVANWCI